jgi:hypothetical protein
LGFVCDSSGYSLSKERRQGLRDMAVPTDTAQARSFHGLVNVFKSFVPGLAVMAKPISALCGKGVPFVWGDEQQQAFENLKDACCAAPVLSFVSPDQELLLTTDASSLGIGGLLEQVDASGVRSPIGYLSKAFDSTQCNWTTIEQESYAIFYAMQKWQHFLLGRKFHVFTDHKNLVYVHTSTTPKVVRWRLQMQEFDFTIHHIAGSENVTADCLSRLLHTPAVEQACAGLDAPPAAEEEDAVRKAFKEIHNATMGHLGIDKSLQKLNIAGFETTPELRNRVAELVGACAICQKTRLRQMPVSAALHTTAVQQPFHTLSIDTVGPLPTCEVSGCKYIIAVVDDFTRFTELYPCKDLTAESAVRAILQVVGRYGMPKMIRSDQGSQYASELVANLLSFMQIEHQFSIPHSPKSMGKVERMNGEIVRHLRVLTIQHKAQSAWVDYLPLVQRIINDSPNRVTGLAPSKLLYGDAVDLSRQLLVLPDEEDRQQTYADYLEGLIHAQRTYARLALEAQQQHVDAYLSKSPDNPTTFEVGDYVLVNYPVKAPTKLHPAWRGPFIIMERNGNTYDCEDILTQQRSEFDVSRLKVYNHDLVVDAEEVATWDEQTYLVESILAHRGSPKKRTKMSFLVRWKDYGPEFDTWEPYMSVKTLEAFQKYADQAKLKF